MQTAEIWWKHHVNFVTSHNLQHILVIWKDNLYM